MIKLFIATPAYSGTVHVQYAISLAETRLLLAKNNIECFTQINCSGSLLVAERNRLTSMFMESDCTHMLCIDGDLGWPAASVLGLLNHDVDFVVGVYPTRKDNLFLFRPESNPDGSIVTNGKNLLSMEYISAGFMLIKRNVIEKMQEVFPESHFVPKSKKDPSAIEGYCLFNTEVFEGEFWGEDYVFCRKARQAGFKIWVDPFIEFDHAGVRGMMSYILTNKKEDGS